MGLCGNFSHLSPLSGEQASQRGWLKALINVHGWPMCHWKGQVMEVFLSKTDRGKKKVKRSLITQHVHSKINGLIVAHVR